MYESNYQAPAFDENAEAPEVGFRDNFVISLKNAFSVRGIIGMVASVITILVLVYLQDYLNGLLAERSTPISLPLLTLMMIAIPVWTVANASRASLKKKQLLNASETAGILGRYVGAVLGATLTMIPAFATIIICMFVIKGIVPMAILESFAVMAAFSALVCAMTMMFNTRVKMAGALTFLVVFVIVPLVVFLIGPFTGLLDLGTICGVIPLVDTISAIGTNGFGGLTVLTLCTLLAPVSSIPTDLIVDILLPVSWALVFLGLTVFLQFRRENQ